jgi:hypothetical protein
MIVQKVCGLASTPQRIHDEAHTSALPSASKRERKGAGRQSLVVGITTASHQT